MSPEQYLLNWQNSQHDAESMYPLLGSLYRDQGVETQIFGRVLVNASTIDILKAHKVARWYTGREVTTAETLPIIKSLAAMQLGPCRVDVGRLAQQYWDKHDNDSGLDDFLSTATASIQGTGIAQSRDVVLYGFGRIGRLLARLMIEKSGLVILCN